MKKTWFRGKKHGYGWGLPTGREGWIVLTAYIVLVFAASTQLEPAAPFARVVLFLLQVLLATCLLLVICYITGEKAQNK